MYCNHLKIGKDEGRENEWVGLESMLVTNWRDVLGHTRLGHIRNSVYDVPNPNPRADKLTTKRG